MEVEHTPAATRLARTVYRLTQAEVICALDEYVRRHQTDVPDGKLGAWVRSDYSTYREKWLATLVVDHDETERT